MSWSEKAGEAAWTEAVEKGEEEGQDLNLGDETSTTSPEGLDSVSRGSDLRGHLIGS